MLDLLSSFSRQGLRKLVYLLQSPADPLKGAYRTSELENPSW
jgi:hypothetical protein